jgi:hypothetical protein
MTQNLRQLGRAELAGSAGAVRELRQTQPLLLVELVVVRHAHIVTPPAAPVEDARAGGGPHRRGGELPLRAAAERPTIRAWIP